VHDPHNNLAAITRVDRAGEVYQGPYAQQGPDLLVGYNRGYRAGWQTILGNFPSDVFEDNTNPLERRPLHGLHLGSRVLLSNHPIEATNPPSPILPPRFLRNLESPSRTV